MLSLLLYLCFVLSMFQCSSPTMISSSPPIYCRNERRVHLQLPEYRSDTCARCYKYMPSVAFRNKWKYVEPSSLYDCVTNQTHFITPSSISKKLMDTFIDESFSQKWISCCETAWQCCQSMVTDPHLLTGTYCPRTWDGWQCWPDTPAGMIAEQPCLSHIYFENSPPSCTKYARKECSYNGSWYTRDNQKEWTNYTTCGRREEHRTYLLFHISAHITSIISLFPALVIFTVYKQLWVPRIVMHRNLFLSLLLNGLFSVLYKTLVVADELRRDTHHYQSVMTVNGSGCKVLFILTKYFRMTNYMWMFCEGFYLQKLIAATFEEQSSLLMFYTIGWVLPLLPVGIYAVLRKTLDDEKCWAFPVEKFEWIMNAPNLLSLLVNVFFLCNIIRVLVTKIRATHTNEPSQYRKAVRATLVLIPLFGLHFCFIIYKPRSGKCGLLQAYNYFSYAMDGLQGFIVASIFCYLNGEVLYLLKRTYYRYKLNYQFRSRKNSGILRRLSTTLTTVNESLNHHHKGHFKCDPNKLKETLNYINRCTSNNQPPVDV